MITARDAERGQQLAVTLDRGNERAQFIGADLHAPADIERLASQAGPVSILVNVAATLTAGPTAKLPLQAFDDMFAVNVRAPHQLVAAVVPSMIAAGGGSIVNISSIGARLGAAGRAAYAASKAALESLTRSWAVEYAPHGIRVNAVAPGPMHGPRMRRAVGEEGLRAAGRSVPLGRTVGPDEVARAVVFLSSADAAYATGAVLAVDGGRSVS